MQIRDVGDDVYLALTQRAAEVGLTVPELLRREAARLASRPSVEEWLERTRLGRRPSAGQRCSMRSTNYADHAPMLVIDASVLFEIVADTPGAEQLRTICAADTDHAAPHLAAPRQRARV